MGSVCCTIDAERDKRRAPIADENWHPTSEFGFDGGMHRHGSFTNARGYRLHYRLWSLNQDFEGLRGVIVHHHGIQGHCNRDGVTDSAGKLCGDCGFAKACLQRDFALCQLDAQGHGWSEGPRFNLEAQYLPYIDDLEDFASKVKELLPPVPLLLAGESWGGANVLHLSCRWQRNPSTAPARWQGTLLFSPAVEGKLPPAPVVFTLRHCCAPCCPDSRPFFMPHPVHADSIWRDEKVKARATSDEDTMGGGGMPFKLGTATALLKEIEDLAPMIPEISFPFAVVASVNDVAIDTAGSENLFKNSKTSAADKASTLDENKFQEAFHDVLCDPESEQILAWALDWAESRLGKPYIVEAGR